jgi:hypothetical protein
LREGGSGNDEVNSESDAETPTNAPEYSEPSPDQADLADDNTEPIIPAL